MGRRGKIKEKREKGNKRKRQGGRERGRGREEKIVGEGEDKGG